MNYNTSELVNDVIHYLSVDETDDIKTLISNIKKINKLNPYKSIPEKYMWEEQCGINIPLLYISSIFLYIYSKQFDIDTYLFTTRDCSQWYKIFKSMYPDEHVIYFNSSRNMLDSARKKTNKYYDEYVKGCIKTSIQKTIFIDIHGTGKRIISYFKNQFNDTPYSFLLSSSYRKYADFPLITRTHYKNGKFINLIFDARGSPIEMLNYDVIGTLQTYKKTGPVRAKTEYSRKYLEPYHICVDYFCEQSNPIDLDNTYDLSKLHQIIRKIYRTIQDNKPAISMYIKHPAKHPKLDITT